MSDTPKPKGTLANAMSDEQGQVSSVRVGGLAQVALTIILMLLGAWAAYAGHKDLVAFVEKVSPWSSSGAAFTLLWGQLKSGFVLGQQVKGGNAPPTTSPATLPPQTSAAAG